MDVEKTYRQQFADVLSHRQFTVHDDVKITNGVDGLYDDESEVLGSNRVARASYGWTRAEPCQLSFVGVEL